jgi:hypothetical protein
VFSFSLPGSINRLTENAKAFSHQMVEDAERDGDTLPTAQDLKEVQQDRL